VHSNPGRELDSHLHSQALPSGLPLTQAVHPLASTLTPTEPCARP
jgi:hypothetical protein